MKLIFLDETNFSKNIDRLKSLGYKNGAILCSLGLKIEEKDNGALLYFYEEINRLADTYDIFLDLNLFSSDEHIIRKAEYMMSSVLRTVYEGFYKVDYLFAGLSRKNEIERARLLGERFDILCQGFLFEYQRIYKLASKIDKDNDMRDLGHYSSGDYKRASFFMKRAMEAERNEEIHEDSDIKYLKHSLRYSHLCRYTHGNISEAFKREFNLKSFVSYDIPSELERLSKKYINYLSSFGVEDVCKSMLDNRIKEWR